MCNRVLLLFGKLPQWNLHLNCHVNGTTFQSGLSSLRVSCKRALRATSSKKTNEKAPTNVFDTASIDDRLKNFSRFIWYVLNSPWKNLSSPLKRPFPPKIAIGPNPPPLLRILKNLQSPLNPGGIPTMSNVGQFLKFCLRQQLYAFKEFRMETRLLIISKTTTAKKFIKTILKSSY